MLLLLGVIYFYKLCFLGLDLNLINPKPLPTGDAAAAGQFEVRFNLG